MQGNKNNLFYNNSGYPDPTSFDAIKGISTDGKAGFLIRVIKFIIREAGFELISRIELRHKESGRIYK